MPFMLIVVGLVLVITSIQNTYAALGAQLKTDFTGKQSFTVWMLALISVGALGYVSGWEKFSRYFMALILITIFLANSKNSKTKGGVVGSFFDQFNNPKASAPAPDAANPFSAPSSTWQSNGKTGDANPMNQGLFGQSSQGLLGDQSRFNNFMNSLTKGVFGGYN